MLEAIKISNFLVSTVAVIPDFRKLQSAHSIGRSKAAILRARAIASSCPASCKGAHSYFNADDDV